MELECLLALSWQERFQQTPQWIETQAEKQNEKKIALQTAARNCNFFTSLTFWMGFVVWKLFYFWLHCLKFVWNEHWRNPHTRNVNSEAPRRKFRCVSLRRVLGKTSVSLICNHFLRKRKAPTSYRVLRCNTGANFWAINMERAHKTCASASNGHSQQTGIISACDPLSTGRTNKRMPWKRKCHLRFGRGILK